MVSHIIHKAARIAENIKNKRNKQKAAGVEKFELLRFNFERMLRIIFMITIIRTRRFKCQRICRIKLLNEIQLKRGISIRAKASWIYDFL